MTAFSGQKSIGMVTINKKEILQDLFEKLWIYNSFIMVTHVN